MRLIQQISKNLFFVLINPIKRSTTLLKEGYKVNIFNNMIRVVIIEIIYLTAKDIRLLFFNYVMVIISSLEFEIVFLFKLIQQIF